MLSYRRGSVRSDLGDKQGAISDYDEVIRLKPDFAYAYLLRGIAKDDLGDKSRITDVLRAAELFKMQGDLESYNDSIKLIEQVQ